MTTLADLAPHSQWVAWRNEDRDGKQTKVPYVARERRAEADDPTTWLTHDKAAALAEIIINGTGGGIGIELGRCRNVWLAGIDFDTCRDPVTGDIEPWAQTALDRFGTYSEVSPSGTGIKAFLLLNPADIDALRAIMRTQHGRQFKRANGSAHPPAIELYVSNRYFAVTWQACDDAPNELRLVPFDDLRWLIEEAGPAFAGKPKHEGDSSSSDTILARLNTAAAHNKAVDTALRNAATMKGGSRSEGAFGLGAALKRAGWSYEDMKAALLACPATRQWAAEKQAEGERQFERIWQQARQPDEPPPQSDNDTGKTQLIPAKRRNISEIPPRPWAYGRFMLFGSASCIGAMDGSGKGLTAVTMALSFITGKPLLGEHIWRTGLVAVLSYEDDQDEWDRRIAAACLQHQLNYDTVIQRVAYLEKRGGKIVIAQRGDQKTLFPDSADIIHQLKAAGAVLLIVDPFNNAHTMEDGNNNVAIAAVAQEISTIAREANVAVLVLHHLRKSAVGSIDDLMGAVALRANFRAVRIMAVMTEDEASGFGIPPAEHWRYIRIADSKENYAPPLDQAIWFRKVSHKLDNPGGIYAKGDEVGAITPWTPPAAFEGMDYAALRKVFDALAATPHSAAKQARAIPWVGKPLIDLAARSEAQAKRITNLWLQSGVLIPGEAAKGKCRHPLKTLTLNAAKSAAILAPMRPPGQANE